MDSPIILEPTYAREHTCSIVSVLLFWLGFWAFLFVIASVITLCFYVILKLMEYIFLWNVFATIALVEYIFLQEAYYFLALVEHFILQEGSIVPAFILVIVSCLEV
jgi:hypothetical protein